MDLQNGPVTSGWRGKRCSTAISPACAFTRPPAVSAGTFLEALRVWISKLVSRLVRYTPARWGVCYFKTYHDVMPARTMLAFFSHSPYCRQHQGYCSYNIAYRRTTPNARTFMASVKDVLTVLLISRSSLSRSWLMYWVNWCVEFTDSF